ncbi:hypothetical protein F4703DRAFT_1449186 [Phycomyces blakesleeanus]
MATRLLRSISLIPKQSIISRAQVRAGSRLPIQPTHFVNFQKQTFATARPPSTNGERTINIPRIPLLLIGIGFACLGVGLYEYFTSDIQKYPPPIRQALRKALYFSQDDRDTKLALQYFRQALELGIESPEMERDGAPLTGIMIQLGVLLETLGRLPEARQTLTLALRHLVGFENDRESVKDKRPDSDVFNGDLSSLPTQTQKKIVGIAQKLGDIAAKCRLDDEAEKWYTWSVEHLLRISSRPKSEYNDTEEVIFDKDHMPAWLTKAELGGALEALGTFYATHGNYVFAIQLYLQALNMAGLKTCHTSVLMNNLAEAYAAMGRFEEAKQWGQKGLDHAQNPNTRKLNDDGEECDATCGTLLYNMGMLFEQTGDKAKASQFYKHAGLHGRKFKLDECVQESDRALRRIEFEQRHPATFD